MPHRDSLPIWPMNKRMPRCFGASVPRCMGGVPSLRRPTRVGTRVLRTPVTVPVQTQPRPYKQHQQRRRRQATPHCRAMNTSAVSRGPIVSTLLCPLSCTVHVLYVPVTDRRHCLLGGVCTRMLRRRLGTQQDGQGRWGTRPTAKLGWRGRAPRRRPSPSCSRQGRGARGWGKRLRPP